MTEVKVKTHLIITDIHEEYKVKWVEKLIETNPKLVNGLPVFVIVGGVGRTELNTIDIKEIERVGKLMTRPRGREGVTTDKAYVYIKEKGDKETLVCIITHNHVKTFAPMYDKVGWR